MKSLGKHLFTAVVALSTCMSPSGAEAPSNDNFSHAAILTGTNLTVQGTNVEATREAGEPDLAGKPGGRSVWWKWTAPQDGSVIVQTKGSSFDTLLGAFTGSTLDDLNPIVSNDDVGRLKTSLIALNVRADVTYWLAVDGFGGDSGTVQLSLAFRPTALVKPGNDDFEQRLPLEGSSLEISAASFFATKQAGEPNHAGELGGASVWWTWTAPVSGIAQIRTAGSDFDTLLGVYSGTVLTNLTTIAGNDDASADVNTSAVEFNALSGHAYQIAVDGYNGEFGDIQLQILLSDLIRFQNPEIRADGRVGLKLQAEPGQRYAIQVSTNLVSWRNLITFSATNELTQYTDPGASPQGQRFYRARRIAP